MSLFLLYLQFLFPLSGPISFMASGHQATVDIDEPYMTGYVKALSADPLFNEPQDLFHMIKSQFLSTDTFDRQTDDAAFDGQIKLVKGRSYIDIVGSKDVAGKGVQIFLSHFFQDKPHHFGLQQPPARGLP